MGWVHAEALIVHCVPVRTEYKSSTQGIEGWCDA